MPTCTDLYGQTAVLPARHRPVMKRERRPSKAEAERDRKAERMAWLVAPATEDESWFRHHNWQARRSLVRHGLISTHATEFQMNRFDECGSECLVEWSESEQRYRLRANHCRCRHCAPCNKAKGSLLSKNLRERLTAGPADGQRFRFVTLTLKHSPDDGLRELITRLYDCFRRLRNSPLWKESQDGGAIILEVKWSQGGGWHPHLHVISEGHFMKDTKLQSEWHRITGDSFKADIRKLDNIKDVCFYVAKYVGKGVNDDVWSDLNAATEYIIAMKGVRFCATFGKWRGFALLKPDKAHDAKDWKPVCLLDQLARRARNGEQAAIQLLILLDDALTYNPHKKRNTSKRNDSTA